MVMDWLILLKHLLPQVVMGQLVNIIIFFLIKQVLDMRTRIAVRAVVLDSIAVTARTTPTKFGINAYMI